MGADLQQTGARTKSRVDSGSKPPYTPTYMRIGGIALRTLFLIALAGMTLRVSIPQNEHVWSVQETPGDLIRLALGLTVCVACLVQLFKLPKDPESRRIWFYFGLVAVPLTLVFAAGIW